MILLSADTPAPDALACVLTAMRAGGVVVIPTDTVYGLACDPADAQAVARIFELKARPPEVRLPVIVSGASQARALGARWSLSASLLADAYWPGALTIAVGLGESPVGWLAGRDEIGLRAPDTPLLLGLAEAFGPFVMTSANAHGVAPASELAEVLASLAGEPAVALDGGRASGTASTLVNVNVKPAEIVREGAIPRAHVQAVLRGARMGRAGLLAAWAGLRATLMHLGTAWAGLRAALMHLRAARIGAARDAEAQ